VLGALERQQLVWTDLRASNFVLVGPQQKPRQQQVKAIDLESAVPVGHKPVDCTPEVTPPEVVRLYVNGQLSQARVAPAYDVWSLGCLVLFLASGGKTLFHGQPPNRQMLAMATLTPQGVSAELQRLVPGDARTRAFLERVLVVDPAKRPTLGALRRDLYLASPF
jgi:serine/threonine protein kinase